MGMFDWVNVEMECPCCNTPIKAFQTRDSIGARLLVDPEYIDKFYAICINCKTRIEFSRTSGKIEQKVREVPYSRKEVEEMGFIVYTEELHWLK